MEQTVIEPATTSPRPPETADAAAAIASDQPVPVPVRLTISARFLLGIYAIVPLCLIAMFADRLFWRGALIRALPTTPEGFLIFQLLFGTPHIIASSLLLASSGIYVRAYWLRIVLFTVFIILFFAVGQYQIPFAGFVAIIGAVTVLHVIKQQVGIGKGICRLSCWTYELWGWTLIVFGSILYYPIYGGISYGAKTAAWIHPLLWALAGVIAALTVVCHFQIRTLKGRLYLWANALMVLQACLFYFQGYNFLAIIGPRLVHDLTAFTFYVAHDVNRHRAGADSLLYRLASKLGLGVFWVCPALAVLLTYLIGSYADPIVNAISKPLFGVNVAYGAAFLIVGYLGLLHYFTEAFTWKHGSPYRQYIAMSA